MSKRNYDDYYRIYDDDDSDLLPEEHVPVRKSPAKRRKKKKNTALRNMLILLVCLAIILGVLVYTTGIWKEWAGDIGADFIADNMNTFEEEELTYCFDKPEVIPDGWVYSEDVVNVLLVGVEAIKSNDPYKGRSDSMILVSQNTKTGEIKLVSFLRDTYVEIEGHDNNKLNAAFSFGQMDLLIPTIQNTYHFFIDGVALVNFADFEDVIDTLGGVDVTLTSGEASYLNRTNYISDPANRTVVEGLNHMNGNQALGYCRVRKVDTMDGDKVVSSDYGRTTRQRKVLAALFDAYKNYPKTQLLGVTKDILSIVKCSLSEDQISYCLSSYLKHPGGELATCQMPAKGYFTGKVLDSCGDCLIPDYEANISILHNYLYGTPLSADITPAK